MHWGSILISVGYDINIRFLAKALAGVGLIIAGNHLSRLKRNFIFGIRNPWTCSTEEVWRKANRIGGYVLVLAGIALAADAFVQGSVGGILAVCILVVALMFNTLYSYHIYKRQIGKGKGLRP